MGLAITFGSIVLGTLLAAVDPFAGIALIVVGGVVGLAVMWQELS